MEHLYRTSTRLYTGKVCSLHVSVCVCGGGGVRITYMGHLPGCTQGGGGTGVCVCVCVWKGGGGRVCMTYIGHLQGCTQGRCAHVSVWGVGYV